MLRTHTCGELRTLDINKNVILCGWIQRVRDKGGMIWIDLRDRYGVTQLIFEEGKSSDGLKEKVRTIGREFVVKIQGKVVERLSKNDKIPTGEIEILVEELWFEIMSHTPKTLPKETMAVDALDLMKKHNISQLIITDKNKYAGMVHLHDLVREGII